MEEAVSNHADVLLKVALRDNQQLKAENQRLREALTKIEDVNLPSGYEGDWHDAYEGARLVAREALAGDAE
jgi:hypothetical protein